ncbi:glycosyltransferase [Marinobacter sp.]|uniref:glycosyltransferase n=1 Tax=Marinobacter sp. TaxID=50741 RepID=UPI003A945234
MEQHTADLAGALADRGHRIHVLGHRAYREKFPANIGFHPLPVHLGRRNLWLQLALRRCLRRLSPDILHAQGNKAAQLAGKTGKLAGMRVGTVHGIKSSHKAFTHLDRVITVSPQIFRALQHPHKHLIYNGVDVTRRPQNPEAGPALQTGITNVIAVGRLESVKGFDVLIRAWSRLGALTGSCHLTIFGEGRERQPLEDLIRQSGQEQQVTLPGFCKNLAPAYEQAQLTVISSEREGFPYVLVESLLYGCPVVSTPVSGPRDILPATAISKGHSDQDLADLLSRALADLNALHEAEKPAMAFAREKLTLEAMVAQTETLYLEAMASKSGS